MSEPASEREGFVERGLALGEAIRHDQPLAGEQVRKTDPRFIAELATQHEAALRRT